MISIRLSIGGVFYGFGRFEVGGIGEDLVKALAPLLWVTEHQKCRSRQMAAGPAILHSATRSPRPELR